MAQEPRRSDYAYNGSAPAVNPSDVAPDHMNSRQQAAVANVVAADAAKGANVYTFDPKATPEEKAAVAKKGGFAKGLMGAPKSLGRGVMNAGSGVASAGGSLGRGVVNAGTGAVGVVGHGAGAIVSGAGTIAGGVAGGVGSVAGGVVGGVGGIGHQAKNALGSMPGMGALKDGDKNEPRSLAIDTSTAGDVPVPTVTLEDAKKATKAAMNEEDIPGNIPKTVLPGIPGWVALGWKEAAGLEGSRHDAKTAEELSILSTYINDQYLGQWFHNAGIIVFAVIATRFITVVRLGWGWVFIILAFCATVYSLSVQRTRQRARDDIQRELVKTRLVTETESADWLNGFLDRFWLIYEPVLSQTIVASVDPALEANCPGFLESIKLTTFTLGNKAPRIDYVRTFPKTPDDVVIMDWALSFTPNDIQDVTPKQAANRVNPKIVLEIRLGKGFVSTGMPILLEDLSFSGKMRIKLKLMTNFPHIQRVEMSFLEKPTFDYVLKPIGGETFGFDINSIPGLAPFIRDQVHANLGPMMYDPNVFTIDLEQLLSGAPLDAANGVLKVTVLDGRGLKGTKIGGGSPDPYVALSMGAKPPVARTKTITSSTSPAWNESHFILVNSLNDMLNFNLFDYNEVRADNPLGTVSQELATLNDDATQEAVVGKVLHNGKERGEVRYDLSYYPVIQAEKNADGTFNPVPDLPSGIVRLTIHQAKDFGLSANDVTAHAKVYLGNGKQPIHETQIIKKNNSPAWESHTEFLVADKQASVVTVDVTNTKTMPDSSLGRVTVRLADILAGKEKNQDWFPLKGKGAAKIRLTADFKPVAIPGSIDGAKAYQPPIGILRIWLKDAVDVKNVEAALGGKSDPYVRVMVGNKTLARTEVIDNSLSPAWDQIVYVPVHSLRERVVMELMDYQNIGKDRTLGSVELNVGDCVREIDNNEWPYQSTGHQVHSERISLGKGMYKGTLNYEVDFKPAMSLRGGVSFDAKENDLQTAAEEKKSELVNGSQANGSIRSAQSGSIKSTPSAFSDAKEEVGVATPVAPPKDAKASIADAGEKEVLIDSVADESPENEAAKEETGVKMTTEQLLQCQSGILVFQVIEGQLARKGALEILLDDGYWPAYVSERARSSHARWDQVGEGFVRELDFGRTWLRINANDDSDKEDIVAEIQMDTRTFLEQALNKEATFTLVGPEGQNRSQVRMSARYIPVDIKLEPRESINDQGMLRVTVIGGKNLKGVDRSGKSDPNISFFLNGLKVFKSETKKKTLHPVWNETFETVVPSRARGQFKCDVNDWDRVGTAELMGSGIVDLSTLEPFEGRNVEVPITHNGQEHGTVQLNLLFSPMIIARHRTKTSTFSAAGRTVTNIGGAALGAPVAVGKGVVGGVGSIVRAPTALFRKKDRSGSSTQSPSQMNQANNSAAIVEEGYDMPAAAGQVSAPAGMVQQGVPTGQLETTAPQGMGTAPTEPGQLSVTVISGKDFQPQGSHNASALKPYVVVKCAGRSHKTDHGKGTDAEWNETFGFNVSPGTNEFSITVLDKHTLGRDVELGEGTVDIWRHVQPAIPTADVFVELNQGSGQVKLRLDWQAGVINKGLARQRSRTPSVSSKVTPDTPRTGRFTLTPSKSNPKDQ